MKVASPQGVGGELLRIPMLSARRGERGAAEERESSIVISAPRESSR